MPLITVWNWRPCERSPELATALHAACWNLNKLGLTDVSDVSVCFGGDEIHGFIFSPLIIVVELLFDKPERTPEVRQKLAEELGKRAKEWLRSNYTSRPVEVAVKRFNPERDAFWVG